jgi:acyl-CoA synthetase (AMP-forming)/AMP-acid ligase II
VRDLEGREVAYGEEGELYITGGSVMSGYWNLPEQNSRAFFRDENGVSWYRTGDQVRETDGGVFLFGGRRDRMVKRRSYRVELGEIETALYRHPSISEAAVIARPDEESGVQIWAYYVCPDPKQRLSLIELKQFCARELPAYMVPDRFSPLQSLPKTSTDKTDYKTLEATVG